MNCLVAVMRGKKCANITQAAVKYVELDNEMFARMVYENFLIFILHKYMLKLQINGLAVNYSLALYQI
ncbi:unnamed protein product [Paramecium pentaurelia]|uniref:Uncharacterized protein n=1 Tax=Paramecium pentaurelia TaxID=43138 RepID=A0A8S1THQ4_9CILI|nr:unnamed protein product [Paramecium pentaurelia]